MADIIADVLRTLKAERDKIDAAIQALQTDQPTVGAPIQAAVPLIDGRFAGKSLSLAAKAVLAESNRPMHVNELVEAIEQNGLVIASADKPNNVGAVLNGRMKRKGDVKRVDRGTWQIVELNEEEPSNPFDDM